MVTEDSHLPSQLDRLSEMVSRFFRYFHGRSEAEGGLSRSQYFLLHLLDAGGVQTVSDLALKLDVTAAGATGLVDRLSRQDLVQRRRDQHDRRLVWVELGAEGRRRLESARALRRKVMAEILSRLSPAEAAELLRLYEKMMLEIPEPGASC